MTRLPVQPPLFGQRQHTPHHRTQAGAGRARAVNRGVGPVQSCCVPLMCRPAMPLNRAGRPFPLGLPAGFGWRPTRNDVPVTASPVACSWGASAAMRPLQRLQGAFAQGGSRGHIRVITSPPA
jgi:hypothetical protein